MILQFDIRPLLRMKVGMFLAAGSFAIAGFVQLNVETEDVSVLWQVFQFFVLTAGEVMVSISGIHSCPNINKLMFIQDLSLRIHRHLCP
jgi:dipeptide/tripeptide permease